MSTELTVKYESAFGDVQLSQQTVKQYLVRGNAAVTDQEVMLFMNLCKFQKLNPFTNEVYLIKFNNSPATTVVGRDAYLRRAYENPSYMGCESGIVVQRGNQIVQKQGTCLYPGETLLGGWCKVNRKLNGETIPTFKEVALKTFDKKQSSWNTMPEIMICKVAESQALRAAFPSDFEGLYTAEEIGDPNIDPPAARLSNGQGRAGNGKGSAPSRAKEEIIINDNVNNNISREQRQELFRISKEIFGNYASEQLKPLIAKYGYDSTANLTNKDYEAILQELNKIPILVKSSEPEPVEDVEIIADPPTARLPDGQERADIEPISPQTEM
ncbi:MAG: phage recombination protein Bet [Firmicutes bacterium]|nr:phage recombination protein Bet [Bacillota bacterium]